jgi:hypothetical protein
MFDIPEKGKDIVISFLNDKFGRNGKPLCQSGTTTGVLNSLRKKAKLKNLLVSKSLIVKF